MSGCDQSQMPVDVIVYRYRQHPGSDSAVAMVEFLNFHTNTFGKLMPQLCFSALDYKAATFNYYKDICYQGISNWLYKSGGFL